MKRFKKLYDCLLESDELYSGMTGDWEKDKDRFIREQKELEELANLTQIDLDAEEEHFN